ncbi:Gfo/Idh/MocA family protein [Microlunatus soli]|uniref:Predicted dehydrogenase n=1 Tax=Microlunatus soli TaxID=630515 RepID=A0A1H1X4J9_9ACTN|nr:Gfo/Idh/MocA family oxidoreductase [Microlunatus soli]SDT04257.1 Predicted dehydrogenase [Microlunatus soli]
MIDTIVLGAAHPHVDYLLTEAAATADVRVVAAAEPDPVARERFLRAVQAPVYADPDRALAEHPAAVGVVCGVYSRRAELVIDCLQRGMSVLVDKPMCTGLDQLRAIERAAAESAGSLAIMFDKRFYPETLALTEVVHSGELGDLVQLSSTGPHKLLQPTRPDWFFSRHGYGGIANDLPVHDIDILLRLTDATSGRVAAITGNHSVTDHPEFADQVGLIIDTGGLLAMIDANWLQPDAAAVHGDYRMRIVGTEGTADVDWPRHRVTVTTRNTPERTLELATPTRPVQFYFDALRTGEQPAVTTAQSILATRIALTAQLSADNDGAWKTF